MGKMNWTVGTHTLSTLPKAKQNRTKPNQKFDQANKMWQVYVVQSENNGWTRDGDSSLDDWLTGWMTVVSYKPTMVLSMLMTIIYIYFLLGSGRGAVCSSLAAFRSTWNHPLLFGYFILFYLRFYVHCAINCYQQNM